MKEKNSMKIHPNAHDISIQMRRNANTDRVEYAVYFRAADYAACTVFSDRKTAKRYAQGKEITSTPPKKGLPVMVVEEEGHHQKDAPWTERVTGHERISAPLVGYHTGLRGRNIQEIETCFYASWPWENIVPPGTVRVEVPVGTDVTWFDNEFRATPTREWKIILLPAGEIREGE